MGIDHRLLTIDTWIDGCLLNDRSTMDNGTRLTDSLDIDL
jgi:hypothetical protein